MPTALTTRESGILYSLGLNTAAQLSGENKLAGVLILCFILYFHLRTQPSSIVEAVLLVRPLWAAGLLSKDRSMKDV